MLLSEVHGFQASPIFQSLDKYLKGLDEDEAKKISSESKAVFQFNIKNRQEDVESWTIDLKNSKPCVTSGIPAEKADVVISTDDDLFIQIFCGNVRAQKAFLRGKLKVKGQFRLATKFEDLLKQVRYSPKL